MSKRKCVSKKHRGNPYDIFRELRNLAQITSKKYKTSAVSLIIGESTKHKLARDEFCYLAMQNHSTDVIAIYLRRYKSYPETGAERHNALLRKLRNAPQASAVLRAYCQVTSTDKDEPFKRNSKHRKFLCKIMHHQYNIPHDKIAELFNCKIRTVAEYMEKRKPVFDAQLIAQMNEFITRITNARASNAEKI